MKRFLYTALLALVSVTMAWAGEDLTLWYDKPAAQWTEALPVGNGRLGAMVFGGTDRERIQLNEENVWTGHPNNNARPSAREYMPRVRQLVFEGKYREAQDMVGRQLISNTNQCMSYQPVGYLNLTFPGHERFTDYRRELNISDAVATTRYTVDGVTYKREVFASFAHDVTVVRLTASKKGALTFTANLTSPLKTQTAAEDGALVMRGASGGKDNLPGGKLKFTTVLRAEADGEVTCTDGEMRVSGATAVTLYVSIGTNFVNYRDIGGDADKRAFAALDAADGRKYAKLLKAHSETYQHYFNRVSLDLGTTPAMNLPTDKRVEQFATGDDPQLVSLYFQFGRYLLISCSQPGGQAANLQGIWNEHVTPPWGSKYTTNINAEMNYWPAEVTHLAEMHEPFLRMVREVAQSGAETAREMYGARGWCLHHNTDIWRATAPVDGPWGQWPTGGAWFCQHLWWHYLYGGDKDFLASVYPVMKGAAEFFLDIMVPEPKHGWLVVPLSTSPENAYKGIHVADGITMDNQMVYELFSNVIQATEVLGTDKAFAEEVSVARAQMAPMQIGRHGQLQEWKEDWDRTDDHHRHVSHLWGLFPGQLISPFRTPEIFEGVRNSLNFRGDPATGWSMGWKVCLWARLLDGDRAYKLITEQLRPSRGGSGGTYPNLFDAHPPFQIDGNFGCAAGIAEMLMQSHDGAVHLLPALPTRWKNGAVSGLCVRGGFVVEKMIWVDGKLTEIRIKSTLGGNLRLRSHTPLAGLTVAVGGNPNPFFAVTDVPAPVVSKEAKLQPKPQPATYLYDIDTEAGMTYTFRCDEQSQAPRVAGTFDFHGFEGTEYDDGGVKYYIVKPRTAATGNPWVWRARFWGHEPQLDRAMLERGFHVCYCEVGDLFGSEKAIARWDRFYAFARRQGLAKKACLEGMSRGGLIVYNWAVRNTDKVAAIYADAPVMDLKSWPLKCDGYDSRNNQAMMKAYGFATEEDIRRWAQNPIDHAKKMAKSRIPLLHIVGDKDTGVPVAENTGVFEQRLKQYGGTMEVIHKPDCGHHPHSLPDPAPIVDFFLKAAVKR